MYHYPRYTAVSYTHLNPKIIIADEPTGNVDPDLSFEIVDLLSEINRRGTTVLMVTHEHDLVQHFHKRVIEIHGGCLLYTSSCW